ncbi:hypothetical protein DL98DRAFT_93567 [Cadophora sp. DSE1049]|nr:hypothetical protein DL98DRAFT_93567 [Cadophora sp. DSE1049]
MDDRSRPVETKTEPTTEVVDFVPSNDIVTPESTSVIPSPPETQDQATHDPAIQGQATWDQASQPRPTEPQANLEEPKTQKDEEQPHTEEQDAPDDLPSNEKSDVPNEAAPVVDPESHEDKGKGPASPETPLNPELLTVPKTDDTPEDTISPGGAPSRKSFFGRIVPAKLPQWATKATTKATPTSGDGTIETRENTTEGKNDDEKQYGVERDDKEGPSLSQKLLDQGDRTGTGDAKEAANKDILAAELQTRKDADEKAAVEKKAENVKKQAKKAEEKAALEKKLEDEKKQAEIDLWKNSCKLDVLPRPESNHPTVDIVAIHDLDETPKTAWVFIPPVSAQKAVRTLLENDLESKRSSLDRVRQLQSLAKVTEESNKRRGSVNRDTTPDFKDGKITPEGRRNKVNDFLSTVDADSSAAVDPPAATKEADSTPPAAPTTFSSEAGPSNAAPPQEEEPQAKMTGAATSSAKELDPKRGTSGKDKKENEGTLTKRGKSGRRKVRKAVVPDPLLPTDHVPPIPLVPAAATIPQKLVVPEPGVDDRTQTKDTGGSRVSEKDPRSGRGSTEIDGSVRKRHVHLLLDGDMIPGSFPGARILSYTYPIMSATTSKEYLDNAARRLLDRLVTERADERYNSVPIVFIGYGFGGLVLQKLLLLAAEDHEEKSKGAAQILNMAAGLVVLDTPFPVVPLKNQTEKDPFPPDLNARQQHILGRLKASGNTLNVRTLWESFNNERVRHKLPLNWLYTLAAKDASSVPKVQPKRPIPALAQIGIFCMAMVSDSKRRLGRFPGPQDEIYIRLVSQMQRCLLFKSAAIKELEDLLTHLIKQPDVLVHVKDEQGKSALHYAAEAPNSAAVTILINLGEAEVLQRDNLGQTPLHACILRAVATNPTDVDGQKPYKDIIKRLMGRSPDVNQTDNNKKTAWDYAPDLTWIQDLRINRDPFSGRSTSNETETVKSVRPLKKDSLKRKACQDTLGLLTEFYLLTDKHTTDEKFNYEQPSIFDMIYDEKEEGAIKILHRSRPKSLTNEIRRCRWMHLPANNEQWVQDLFLTLKIKDNSIHGQREGKHALVLPTGSQGNTISDKVDAQAQNDLHSI